MATIDRTEEHARPERDLRLTGQQAEAYSLVFERLAHTAHDAGDEHRAVVLALRALRLLAEAGDPEPCFPRDRFSELPGTAAVPTTAALVESRGPRP